jgi:DNA-directed RNA polymerase specialized sigma24 family protein
MSVGQLASILAHEFGHFSENDTRLAAAIYVGHDTLAHTVDRLDASMPVPGFLLGFVRRQVAQRRIPESALDTEGVVQEAFALALRHWPTIQNPLAWLHTVTGRLVGRADGRTGPAADAGALVDAGTPGWSSVPHHASVEEVVLARAVVRDIADLPHGERLALYLHRVQEWTFPEINVELLDKPADTSTVRGQDRKGARKICDRWLAFLHGADPAAARRSDGLAALVLAAAVAAGLVLLLRSLGVPTPAAVAGPPAAVVGVVVVCWVARGVAQRRARARFPGRHRRVPE